MILLLTRFFSVVLIEYLLQINENEDEKKHFVQIFFFHLHFIVKLSDKTSHSCFVDYNKSFNVKQEKKIMKIFWKTVFSIENAHHTRSHELKQLNVFR